MLGYCVRCKKKQEMLSATRTLMSNNRRAMIGFCGCCGTKMSVAGVWDGDERPRPAPESLRRETSAPTAPPAPHV